VVLPELLEAFLVLLFKQSPQLGFLSQMASVKGLDVAAMLNAKFGDLLPVVLLLQMERVLQVVNLSLEVKAHFLHAGFQGTHLLLLQLDDLLLLETDQGTDDLIRG
jgi:hypothetical protein